MKLLESILELVGKQNKPIHVGEVMNIWKLMAAFEEGHAVIMGFLNHTADVELKRFMESYLRDFEEPWMKRIKHFMQEQGIPFCRAGTDKPKANEADIPGGAKFTDEEIACFLAAKIVAGTQVVQHGLLECLHYEVASLLMELEMSAYRQGFVLRQIMERRGWMKFPPYWYGHTLQHQ